LIDSGGGGFPCPPLHREKLVDLGNLVRHVRRASNETLTDARVAKVAAMSRPALEAALAAGSFSPGRALVARLVLREMTAAAAPPPASRPAKKPTPIVREAPTKKVRRAKK